MAHPAKAREDERPRRRAGPAGLAADLIDTVGAARSGDVHYLEAEFHALLQQPRTVRFLDEGALDGLWYWDLQSPEHEWMSPGFWRTLGFDPAEKRHLASEWQDLIFPEDLAEAQDNAQRHFADPSHPYDQLVRYRTADGGTVTIRCRGLAIRENGAPVRMLGAHTVVHDTRKHALDRQLSDMLELSGDAIMAWSESRGTIRWNRGAEQLYGLLRAEVEGRDPNEATRAVWPGGWDRVRTALHRDGSWAGEVRREGRHGIVRHTSTRLQRQDIHGTEGDTLILQVDRDITAEVEARQRQEVMTAELNHRVKNNLAVIRAVSVHTFGHDDPRTRIFGERLAALGKAHDLLTRNGWVDADLAELVIDAIRICPNGRSVSCEGPPVRLRAQYATSIAMALHELCTNAIKHGALSAPDGRVDISWSIENGETLAVRWAERGGPAIPGPPATIGFGLRLLSNVLASDLQGGSRLDWRRDGLRVSIRGALRIVSAEPC